MQTLGLTQGCSSHEGNPIFNSYPIIGNNNYKLMGAEKQDHFVFQKGEQSIHFYRTYWENGYSTFMSHNAISFP